MDSKKEISEEILTEFVVVFPHSDDQYSNLHFISYMISVYL